MTPIITMSNVIKKKTMETKIEPNVLYEGLGFPIELESVEMIKFNDE